MSKAEDILQVIARGETSRMQMKERITDKYEVACELVAFSNSKGGQLIVGVLVSTTRLAALTLYPIAKRRKQWGFSATWPQKTSCPAYSSM